MKIIAHRGASKEAEENTLEAFQKALDIGVDAIELDCLITKDQIPVVTHFDNLKYIKQKLAYVRDLTYQELKGLNIPTLEEVLKLIQPSETKVILDIKVQTGLMFSSPPIIAKGTQKILPPEQCLMSSFHWRHLWVLRKEFPQLPRGLILMYAINNIIPAKAYHAFFDFQTIHPRITWIQKKTVERWQEQGFEVYVWVANTPEEISHCEAMGVDGIFTDDPRLAKQLLKR